MARGGLTVGTQRAPRVERTSRAGGSQPDRPDAISAPACPRRSEAFEPARRLVPESSQAPCGFAHRSVPPGNAIPELIGSAGDYLARKAGGRQIPREQKASNPPQACCADSGLARGGLIAEPHRAPRVARSRRAGGCLADRPDAIFRAGLTTRARLLTKGWENPGKPLLRPDRSNFTHGREMSKKIAQLRFF